MNSPDGITHQNKLHELAEHLRAASDLLKEIVNERLLPLSDDLVVEDGSEDWEKMEVEADTADQQGEFDDFTTLEEAIDFLHNQV